jgi:hypothetical protein
MTHDRAFSIDDYITGMERMKKPGFFKITLTRFELIEKKPGFFKITLTQFDFIEQKPGF